MEKILIVDDEVASFLPALEVALEEYHLLPAKSGGEGLTILEKNPGVAAILLDIKMPPEFGKYEDREGIEVLKHIVESHPGIPVIMLTVMHDIELVVECMKEGAFYYLTKPPDVRKLLAVIQEAVSRERLARPSRARTGTARGTVPNLRAGSAEGETALRNSGTVPAPGYGSLIGASAAMQRVYNTIDKVAQVNANVLVMGASGTGKELVAHEIHNRSPRADGPFRPVNCAAIPKDLLESTLFGHRKGAFTGAAEDRRGEFELAAGGTLFLDEIGDMPTALQAKLLRVLEDKTICRVGDSNYMTVDVRIVSATNQDILGHIEAGKFREDLYFRINTIPIFLPTLAERREDVPHLARFFLSRIAAEYGRGVGNISDEAMQRLMYEDYRGNVRQLRNLVARAVAMCEGDTLELNDFIRVSTVPMSRAEVAVPGAAVEPRNINEDAWNRQTMRESAIREASEFRNRYGEEVLKRLIERAVKQEGDVRKAGMLLHFIPAATDEKSYAAFRQWLRRLDLSKKKILGAEEKQE